MAPTDLNKFLYDYKHSQFIECNKKYASESKRYKNDQGESYESGDIQNLKARHGLNYVKSVLEGFRKNYWLAAGTLLGKLSFNKYFLLKQVHLLFYFKVGIEIVAIYLTRKWLHS